MIKIRKLILPVAGALFAATLAALAGNTTFFTSNGDSVFPFTQPTSSGTAGTIDNMTIGATTKRAGTFTTLTADTIVGAGVTASFASPPPIGSTAPNTGAFTSLAISGPLTSTYGVTTIASGACGATTNGTVAGTNASGLITIGSASTTSCTVSFSATLAVAPNACLVMAANAAAIAATTLPYISAITTGHFVLTGAVLGSTNWYYLCL